MDYKEFKKWSDDQDDLSNEDLYDEESLPIEDLVNMSEMDIEKESKDLEELLKEGFEKISQSLEVNFLTNIFSEEIESYYLATNEKTPIRKIDFLFSLKRHYNKKFHVFEQNLLLQKHTRRENDELLLNVQSKAPSVLKPLFSYLLKVLTNYGDKIKDLIEERENQFNYQRKQIETFLSEQINKEKEKINLLSNFQSFALQQPQNEPLQKSDPIEEPEDRLPREKIVINGTLQSLGFIFNELIKGGYIEPMKFKSGKQNDTATAEMFLEHFEFTNKPKQPDVEGLRKAIFNNQFSMSKSEDFIIPHIDYFDKDR